MNYPYPKQAARLEAYTSHEGEMKHIIVVVRKDIKFKKGPIITQACHAVSALVFENKSNQLLTEYFSNMQELRKITYQVPTLDQLLKCRDDLSKRGVLLYEWIGI